MVQWKTRHIKLSMIAPAIYVNIFASFLCYYCISKFFTRHIRQFHKADDRFGIGKFWPVDFGIIIPIMHQCFAMVSEPEDIGSIALYKSMSRPENSAVLNAGLYRCAVYSCLCTVDNGDEFALVPGILHQHGVSDLKQTGDGGICGIVIVNISITE